MQKSKISNHLLGKTQRFVARHDLAFKSIFAVFFLLFLALQPAIIQGDVGKKIPSFYHDFGIYKERDELLDNISALNESEEIAQIANQALDASITDVTDQIPHWDGLSDIATFENLSLPMMEKPGILDRAADFGIDSILESVLDGRSYYIYANSSDNPDGVWVSQWNVADPLQRPVIHAKVISDIVDLELLDPTPVDIDSDGTDDVEVELVIEATVDGGLSTILDDPLGNIPLPSLPPIPELGDNPPRVRITYPPTNFWVVGRSLISDTWQIGGWTWEFDLETDSPEIERVVISVDNDSNDADWQEANLSRILDLPSPPLLNWFRWTFDLNLRDLENGLHTVYARAYEGEKYTQDSVKIYVSNPIYRGVRLLVNVDRLNDAFNQSCKINILRPLSQGDTSIIWALGMDFGNVSEHFTAYLKPEILSLGSHLPSPGSLLSGSNLIEYMQGPYNIGWNATEMESHFALQLSHTKVNTAGGGNFTETTWFALDFKDALPPSLANIKIELNGTLDISSNISADVTYLQWNADKITDLRLTYHDERDNETLHLVAEVIGMPESLEIAIENRSSVMPYDVYTALNFTSSSRITSLSVTEHAFESGALDFGFKVNISNLPNRFILNGTYSALSIQAQPPANLSGNYTFPFLWDILSVYIGGVFAQVADRAASLPRRVLSSALIEGEYEIAVLEGQKVGGLSFYLTSDIYTTFSGNFIGFYSQNGTGTAISGSLFGISQLFASSNENETTIKASLETDSGFRLVNSRGPGANEFEMLSLDNIPGYFAININDGLLNYSADENIDTLEFLARGSAAHLFLRITDVPMRLSFIQTGSSVLLESDDAISTIEFYATEDAALSMAGDHLLLVTEDGKDMLGGRLSNLKRLHYEALDTTLLSLSFAKNSPFRIMANRDTGNAGENLDLDIFLDNIPNELSLSFDNPAINASLTLPEIGSVTGVEDVTGTMSDLAKMGERMLSLMVNLTSVLTSQLGSFSGGFSLYYSFEEEYDLDLIGRIDLGDINKLERTTWTHGINARGISNGPLSVKVFITGLPQSTEIRFVQENETRALNFSLYNFQPRYSFFLLDIKIQDEIDILFHADNLKGKIEQILINLEFQISMHSTASRMMGAVRSKEPLRNVYLGGEVTDPFPSKIEIMLPQVPSMLDLNLSAENDLALDFTAKEPVPALMLKVLRNIKGKWHSGEIIAHDIPAHLNISLEANTKYFPDTPLLGMPSIYLNASSDTLDLYVNLDARVFGRQGNYEVYAENLKSGLVAFLEKDTYKIRADSLRYLGMRVGDMPLMPLYKLRELKLEIKDLTSLDLKVIMAGGLLPAFVLDNAKVGSLKISLSHEMDILGARISPNVVLSETTFHNTDNPDLALPFKNPTHINGLATTLEGGRTTVVFPNILATLVVTFYVLFIIILVLLLLLFFWVRFKGQDEHSEDAENKKESRPEEESKKYHKNVKTEGLGKRKKVVVLLLLLVILGSLIYYLFVPWVQMQVETDFVETPSGIFVICRATNSGTVSVTEVVLAIEVFNSTDNLMNRTSFASGNMKRWELTQDFLHFFGNQFESYLIYISVAFFAGGREYQRILTYNTENYMRLNFQDSIP